MQDAAKDTRHERNGHTHPSTVFTYTKNGMEKRVLCERHQTLVVIHEVEFFVLTPQSGGSGDQQSFVYFLFFFVHCFSTSLHYFK